MRDFGRRVEFKRKLGADPGLESEETTDGHVSKIHRASKERGQTVVRRAGRKPLLKRMCLELVKNTAPLPSGR